MKLKILDKRLARVTLNLAVWLLFWFFSTRYIFQYNDISATFWSVGIYGTPINLGVFLLADNFAYKLSALRSNNIPYMIVSCIISCLLYYPIAFITIRIILALTS